MVALESELSVQDVVFLERPSANNSRHHFHCYYYYYKTIKLYNSLLKYVFPFHSFFFFHFIWHTYILKVIKIHSNNNGKSKHWNRQSHEWNGVFIIVKWREVKQIKDECKIITYYENIDKNLMIIENVLEFLSKYYGSRYTTQWYMCILYN